MKYILRSEHIRDRALSEIQALDMKRIWKVEIGQYRPKRSLEQNAYLHAVPLKLIAEHTGYSVEDMKEYLLMAAFGDEMKEVMGVNIIRPLKRTSDLTTKEFAWFVEWVASWAMNTLGLLIPMPNETITD
jgi:hypothetical protein